MGNTKEISLGTLYDINKRLMLNQGTLSAAAIKTAQQDIEEWFNWQIDGYAMLLCHERRDYTLFHLYQKANPNPPKIAASELIGLLQERGDILSIDKEGEAWEIWLKIGKEAFVYYLFNYDNGVIEC